MKGGIDVMDVELYSLILGHRTIQMVLVFFFILLLIGLYHSSNKPRKSKDYRRLLTDLYVAGKIRLFAKEDGISFVDEEENFNKWLKKQRLKEVPLDVSVEEELQEKIAKVNLEEKKK